SINPLSPPLSAAATKTARKKRSWVWTNGWTATRMYVEGGNQVEKIVCLYRGCRHEPFVYGGTTTGILSHLTEKHKLNKSHFNSDDFYTARLTGALPTAMANHGKRVADGADYSKDAFNKKVCMYLVRGRLPHIAVESSDLQDLLYMARSAPSFDDLKLPSNDTMSRM
ncbi:hypothetical protein BGX28_002041, partial [Mortierella sp. GBA30]